MDIKFKTAENLQDIWQRNEPSRPQTSKSEVHLQRKSSSLKCAFLLITLLELFWVYMPSSSPHNQKKKKRPKKQRGSVVAFLCFSTLYIGAPNAYMHALSAIHRTYLYLFRICSQKACLSHSMERCARTSALSLGKLVHSLSREQLGACQWVQCHQCRNQCRHVLCLLY